MERVDIHQISKLWAAGKAIVVPTDTLYGLTCSALQMTAIDQVYQVKRRSYDKLPPLLVSCPAMALSYCDASGIDLDLMEKLWPGALTLIMDLKPGTLLAKNMAQIAERSTSTTLIATTANAVLTAGFRCPDAPELVAHIEKLGHPILGTSANISGMPNPLSESELLAQFCDGWDATALDPNLAATTDAPTTNPPYFCNSGRVPHGQHSTIVRTIEPNIIKVIRSGMIDVKTLISAMPGCEIIVMK